MKIQTVARGPVRVADGYTVRLLKTWPMSAAWELDVWAQRVWLEVTKWPRYQRSSPHDYTGPQGPYKICCMAAIWRVVSPSWPSLTRGRPLAFTRDPSIHNCVHGGPTCHPRGDKLLERSKTRNLGKEKPQLDCWGWELFDEFLFCFTPDTGNFVVCIWRAKFFI